ncbi:MAG: aminodeoxychorismate/anthranilate synthase component II [Marinifilaceae bacterium]|jgi:anthranilate synthase component 2|nr:aminodeoxychorismate/anthranilate synthase component II [Marinifilaceae bacterium]
MKIAVVDNFDSFTYNLVHYVEKYCDKVYTMRSNEVDFSLIDSCEKIIFSPGPGIPSEVVAMKLIMDRYIGKKPIFGVCLGMQFIGEYFGAKLVRMNEIIHGVERDTIILDNNHYLFNDFNKLFKSGRYHSWKLSNADFPSCLTILANDRKDNIMAIAHNEYDICGVQFHPESIMTEGGEQIIKNWICQI